jgi:hypothetical protein
MKPLVYKAFVQYSRAQCSLILAEVLTISDLTVRFELRHTQDGPTTIYDHVHAIKQQQNYGQSICLRSRIA